MPVAGNHCAAADLQGLILAAAYTIAAMGGDVFPVPCPVRSAEHLARKSTIEAPGRRAPFTAAKAATASEPDPSATAEAPAPPHGRRSAAARGGPRATRRARRGAPHRAAGEAAAADRRRGAAQREAAPAPGAGRTGAPTAATAAGAAVAPPRGATAPPPGARDTATPADAPRGPGQPTNRSSAHAQPPAEAQGHAPARTDERHSCRGYVGRAAQGRTSAALRSIRPHATAGRAQTLEARARNEPGPTGAEQRNQQPDGRGTERRVAQCGPRATAYGPRAPIGFERGESSGRKRRGPAHSGKAERCRRARPTRQARPLDPRRGFGERCAPGCAGRQVVGSSRRRRRGAGPGYTALPS